MEMGEKEPMLNASEPNPPSEPNNRLFLIIAGIIAGIMLVTIIGMAVYAMLILPQKRYAEATQIAFIDNQNTQAALSAEQTIQAMSWTDTPTTTPVPDTATPTSTVTSTPVVVDEEETEEIPAIDLQTVTAEAQLTEEAQEQSPTPVLFTPTITVQPFTPTFTPTPLPPTITVQPFTPTPLPPTITVQPFTPTPLPPTITVQPLAPTFTPTALTPTVTIQPLTPTNTSPVSTPTITSTPSALPETGYSNASSIPLIVLLSLGLVVVIFFARKLRTTL
jgi:LPXTG-motif cell wall-anchored protein